ncbi:MAG: DHH phosphoesterase [Wendovervirus sonii]|uniref:DHH phosphoesterase n=1 Tax=phage Lak_Megaphage_Sonny TaxID=3109229 RepID=A0ABZ0Z2J4_9CAUD|nr:MAG: DHH phosphoesterase [phage Lak_Megaphage_Sonny]
MKKAIIIYHSEDNDGLFSMAISYWWLRNIQELSVDDINILGTNYNQLSELLKKGKFDNLKDKYDTLIITDVSFNEQEQMLKLYKEFGDNFYWFDHHKPIIDFSMKNELHNAKGLRDTNHSALYNAWKYCFPNIKIPKYLEILSAYDSFTFEAAGIDKEYATAVNQGTTNATELNPKNAITYVRILLTDWPYKETIINDMYNRGREFIYEQDKFNKKAILDFGDTSWTVGDRNACAMFIQAQTSSDFFKSLKGADIKNGIIFKHQKNGNWGINLYNVNEDHSFHCGDYMKEHYNGGGHEGAAGCTVSEEQFIEILKNKKI